MVRSIIQFREVFLTPDYLAIAMEFAPGGDMFQYVKRKKGLQARAQRHLLLLTGMTSFFLMPSKTAHVSSAHAKRAVCTADAQTMRRVLSSWKNASMRHKALVKGTCDPTSSPVWRVDSQVLRSAGARGQVVLPAAHCRA